MRHHAEIRKLLYEYGTGTLGPEARSIVERHLAECASCAAFVQGLPSMASHAPGHGDPDRERPDAYWESFSARVETRRAHRALERRAAGSLHDALAVLVRPRSLAIASAGFAMLLAGFFLWQRSTPVATRPQAPLRAATTTAAAPGARMDRYLQRSKVLLVGINNLRDDEPPADISAERKASQELVHEARELKQQALDPRAARLIEDLEKIQIVVANMDASRPGPDLAQVRHGIRQQNLLFKVRMAEVLYRPGVVPSENP